MLYKIWQTNVTNYVLALFILTEILNMTSINLGPLYK